VAADLVPLHTQRATLLHWWAGAYGLAVDDWGATDAERPAEFVEVLLDVGQATLTAGLGALATEWVKRFLDRRKAKAAKKAAAEIGQGVAAEGAAPAPDVAPLLGLTIVNQSGGTVVVLNPVQTEVVARAVAQVTNPKWRGNEVVL
jgi:hypothetical protein